MFLPLSLVDIVLLDGLRSGYWVEVFALCGLISVARSIRLLNRQLK